MGWFMMIRKYILCKWQLILTALLMANTVPSFANVETFIGKAINAKGNLEFIEEHRANYENDQIASLKTTYFDAEYNKIGEITSDFSAGIPFGSYDFKDERLQYIDGAKVLSDQILLYARKKPQDNIKTKYLERKSNQILGQGFHPFIQENFDELLQGKTFPAKLVLPSRMDQFNVRIRPVKVVDERLRLRIELDNWFLRLFAPKIEAEYEIETRRLVAYSGVSAISNASGKNVQVSISYTYLENSSLATLR